MKKHPTEGAKVIEEILCKTDNLKFKEIAINVAKYHHERWDGNGYPNGIKGEEIPLPARVMAVADVYDAITSKRVYKDSIPPEEAFEIIVNGSGTQFDPDIIRNVIEIKQELIDYVNKNKKEE
jgi:putative two-component system response regulator